MTPEERQMLSGLFERIRNASNGPHDREAEAFINDAMRATPQAGYVLSQTVLVQQQALDAAAKRIQDLEAQVQNAGAQPEGSFLGNLGRSLFGGGPSQQQARRDYDARAYERQPEPPPPGYGQRPAYAPPPPQQMAAGPWGGASPMQPQGGGFLQGALQTATGVAGGVLLGNALGGLFGGHGGGGGMFGGGFGNASAAPRETINETVNNYYETPGGSRHGGADTSQDDYVQDSSFDDNGDDYAGDGGGGDDSWA